MKAALKKKKTEKKKMHLSRGLGARLGSRHEDTEQSHDDQVNFIDGATLILLGHVLQRNNMDKNHVKLKQ